MVGVCSNAVQCYKELARLAVEQRDYKKGIEIYEKIAKSEVERAELGKWCAALLTSARCSLC